MPEFKRGRLGKPEMEFIRSNAETMGLSELAGELNRDPETIRKWALDNLGLDLSENGAVPVAEAQVKNEFRNTPEWQMLREQFTEPELLYFEHRYSRMYSQFKEDVTASEETQLFLLIELEILMKRNMRARRREVLDVERLEKELADFYAENPQTDVWSEADRDWINNRENQLLATREAEQSKTSEYTQLLAKHTDIMKTLKATRDQRLARAENPKQNFIALIKSIQEEKIRNSEGRDAELMRLAMEKESERLSQTHIYADGESDQPILSADNILPE
jgi:hypothetical protein